MSKRRRFKPEPIPEEFARMMAIWTAFVAARKPKGQCRGCAFRAGTLANRCGNTAGKVADVLLRGGDFRCHHATLGAPVDPKKTNRQCRGFATLLEALAIRNAVGKEMADAGVVE